ncbi:MAG: HEAT repeat domain-containing protein [Acidobacteria bacterium]|nr:HEAT repeat domain-containing protein [Acidobacteriota bacterium]
MKNNIDPLFHFLFLDLRFSGDLNFYKEFQPDREPPINLQHLVKNRDFDIEHIKLDLSINEKEKSISGQAFITLKSFLNALSEITLDALDLAVSQVSLAEKKLAYETYSNKLVITLDKTYTSNDTITVAITYSAKPRKGMFFIEPDQSYPKRHNQVWTQCQPDDAANWFPCLNIPADKHTSEIYATVNNRFTTISNGRLVSISEDNKNSTKTFYWKQEEPHASYLMSLIIGEYEEISQQASGVSLSYLIYKGQKEKTEKIFGRTAEMLKLFLEKFGYPYPYSKYSQTLVSDFTFSGMENTSATTLTDILLEWALTKDSTSQDISHDELIAHELAHQWWGNLVTCKSWHHNWLNEGFASYSEVIWQEHAFGKEQATLYRLQDFNDYLRQDLGESRRPVVFDHYAYSVELFDRHAYQKGSLIVHMLRKELGEEAFFKGIKHYLHKHAFKATETHDLKIAMEEATGKELDTFFQQWLYRAGYPEFSVSSYWDNEQKLLRLNVCQTQKVDQDTPLFRLRVALEITTAKERKEFTILVEKREADYYFPLDSKPLMVIFDKGDHILKTLSFAKSKEEYLYQLKHDMVLGRIRAARELVNFNDDIVINTLATVLKEDLAWGVAVASAISLSELKGETARKALEQCYLTSKSGMVRRACIWALGKFTLDDSLLHFLRNAIENDGSDFVVATALQAIANTKTEQAFDIISSALERQSYREVIVNGAFTAFIQLKEKRAIPLAIKLSEYGNLVPARDGAIRFLGEGAKGDEKAFERLTELLKDPAWRTRFQVCKALGKFGDKRAITLLKNVEKEEAIDHIKSVARGVYQALEKQG